ncbi:Hypothetical predicted protein [Cloeon dipterum]|uniref:PSI domain-containing protein n=1 Tax=Cloeon dipterum TaxID=197152 RepID=A0A8S1CY85_9INSE|nr:Hypothetical predicted protein [Cloeon dipterum]
MRLWRSFQTLVWIMIAFTTIPQNSSGFNYCDSASSNAKVVQEDHYYYRSCFLVDKELADELWVPMGFNEEVTADNEHADNSSVRRSGNLTFDFPFYGSLLRTITLLPEGFITLGEDEMYVGLSPVRYIAPLMLLSFQWSPDSYMGYYETDVVFTIQWTNLGAEPLINIGKFSFQVTLHKNGSIVFVYKTIPPHQMWKSYLTRTRAQIGTSNAYQHPFDNSPPLTTQFHKTDLANFDLYLLESSAVIFLDPLPTCGSFKDCESCSQAEITPEGCVWCAKMEKCTDSIQVYSSLELIRGCSDIIDDENNCTSAATGHLNDAGATIVIPESGPIRVRNPNSAYKSPVDLILSTYFDWLWNLLCIFLVIDIICGVIYWNRIRAEVQSLIAWIKKCTRRSTSNDLERHEVLQESDQNASNHDAFLEPICMKSLLEKKGDEVFTV